MLNLDINQATEDRGMISAKMMALVEENERLQ